MQMPRRKQRPRLRQRPTVMPKMGQAGKKVRKIFFMFLPAAKLILTFVAAYPHHSAPSPKKLTQSNLSAGGGSGKRFSRAPSSESCSATTLLRAARAQSLSALDSIKTCYPVNIYDDNREIKYGPIFRYGCLAKQHSPSE